MSETESPPAIALIIDDEVQIRRRLLRVSLEAGGYRVFEAATGRDGLVEAAQRRPDVVVLDLGLPDMDGTEVLKRLREWSQAPVLVLSVREGEDDKVGALDSGADDYMTKPFSTVELLARLRVARRHAQPIADNSVFRTGRLEVDLASRIVTVKRPGSKIDADGVLAAAPAGAQRRQSGHPPADSQGSVGTQLCGANALPARLYGPPAGKDRGRAGPPGIIDDGTGRRLPSDGRLNRARSRAVDRAYPGFCASKAAEDSRTPGRFSEGCMGMPLCATASWSAQALLRFDR